MKQAGLLIIAGICTIFLPGCGQVSDTAALIELRVAAPDFLRGILEEAAQQFQEENRIPVTILYRHPDSVIAFARSGGRVDLFLSENPRRFSSMDKDTLVQVGSSGCPFRLSLVMVGRSDGPRAERLDHLKRDDFMRVVIVDPAGAFEGRLAESVLRRHRLWKKLQTKLILARSTDHLLSYLETGEADAAIMLESSMRGRKGLVVMQHLDRDAGDWLIVCGAVTARSEYKESAQAFLDLLDSRLCPIYKLPGIYRNGD